MPLMDLVDPPLTTIKVGQSAMGATAAGLFLQVVDNLEVLPSNVLIPVQLMECHSTALPRLA